MKESPENTEEYRYKIRHSAAHLLAEAVLKKHPDAKLTIGPPIDDGFFYDFDVDITFSPQDLASIERDMKRSVKRNTKFERKGVYFYWCLFRDESIKDSNERASSIFDSFFISRLCEWISFCHFI